MITVYTQCLNCGSVRAYTDSDMRNERFGEVIDKNDVPKDAKVYPAKCRKCADVYHNTHKVSEKDCIVNQENPFIESVGPSISVEEFDKIVEEVMDLPYEQMRPRIKEAIALIGVDHIKSKPFKKFMALRRDEILARIDEVQITAK